MVLEKDKRTGEWHKHLGYFHAEKGAKKPLPLTVEDREEIAKIEMLWYNRHCKA